MKLCSHTLEAKSRALLRSKNIIAFWVSGYNSFSCLRKVEHQTVLRIHWSMVWLSFKKLTAGGTLARSPHSLSRYSPGLGNDVCNLWGKEQAIRLGWHLTNAPWIIHQKSTFVTRCHLEPSVFLLPLNLCAASAFERCTTKLVFWQFSEKRAKPKKQKRQELNNEPLEDVRWLWFGGGASN